MEHKEHVEQNVVILKQEEIERFADVCCNNRSGYPPYYND